MICQKCNQQNPDDAQFCGNCGAPMARPAVQPASGGTTGEAVSSGLKTGIIIGSIFVPLLGIIMGAIYMQDPNPQKKAVGKLWLQVGIGVVVASCILAMMCSSFSN